jgi:biopolymer transport protein ExbD
VAFDFKRETEELVASSQINVTPFIDVMLVLLVIFMITAPLSAVRIPVDLPVASAQAQPPPPQQPIVLTVQQDLQLALGNMPVARGDLTAAIARLTHGNGNTRIYVRADQSIRYGELMAVMNLLSQGGYQRVALLSREGSSRPRPPPK